MILAIAAFAASGLAALRLLATPDVDIAPINVDPVSVQITAVQVDSEPQSGAAWFQGFRMYCNHVDIDSRLRWQPAPGSVEGDMYKAACYALAGRIDQARDVILGLPQDQQYQAAGVVFNAGHPAADAGDDIAAGPLMELVVEFWPNHYMALYHAGAAAFQRGEYALADNYLRRFLVEYTADDGWTRSAESMLDVITNAG